VRAYVIADNNLALSAGWDDHAVETFKLNFPDVPGWHGT
jgi:hypothetical protein